MRARPAAFHHVHLYNVFRKKLAHLKANDLWDTLFYPQPSSVCILCTCSNNNSIRWYTCALTHKKREREPYLRASTIYQVESDKLYLYEIALISLVSRFWIRRKVLIAELLQIFIISSSIFLNVFIVNPFVKLQESNWTIAQEIWCSPAATAFASCWKSGRKKEGSF